MNTARAAELPAVAGQQCPARTAEANRCEPYTGSTSKTREREVAEMRWEALEQEMRRFVRVMGQVPERRARQAENTGR